MWHARYPTAVDVVCHATAVAGLPERRVMLQGR